MMQVDASVGAPVSVVIPCFRCAETISRAIASVAKQSLLPLEVLLVDDCSGDNTLTIIEALAKKYPQGWIKIVALPKNVGAGEARNAGWEMASGEFVAFLDADDAWHPRKIEIQYAYMSAHPEVDLCGHERRLLVQEAGLPDWDLPQYEARSIHKWSLLLSNKFVTPSVMIRRDVEQRFVEGQRHMEDHMLWLLLSCGGKGVVKLSAELAAIYKSPFGMTGLSAQIWAMERGDLGNYRRLYRLGYIGPIQLGLLAIYSVLKYIRRLVIYGSYLRWKK